MSDPFALAREIEAKARADVARFPVGTQVRLARDLPVTFAWLTGFTIMPRRLGGEVIEAWRNRFSREDGCVCVLFDCGTLLSVPASALDHDPRPVPRARRERAQAEAAAFHARKLIDALRRKRRGETVFFTEGLWASAYRRGQEYADLLREVKRA